MRANPRIPLLLGLLVPLLGCEVTRVQLGDAAARGDVEAVRACLDRGAILDREDRGETALMRAAAYGRTEVVALLLERGADVQHVSPRGETALRRAVVSGSIEIVRSLLERGADPNRGGTDSYYGTIVHLAAWKAEPTLARILLEAGAHADTYSEKVGGTPLHLAASAGNVATIGVLVGAGADVNRHGELGRTPLHLAALGGHPGAILALLQAGAEVEARDSMGRTPLHLAAERGDPRGIRRLLFASLAGADLDAVDPRGWLPLHLAALLGHADCLSLLRGEELGAKTSLGRTALHLASMGGSSRCIETLVAYGIPVEVEDRFGLTAQDLFREFLPRFGEPRGLSGRGAGRPTQERGGLDSARGDPPFLVVYSLGGFTLAPVEGMEVAVWKDGTVLFSPDPRAPGEDLRVGTVSPERCERLAAEWESLGLFELGNICDVPMHAASTRVSFRWNGRFVRLELGGSSNGWGEPYFTAGRMQTFRDLCPLAVGTVFAIVPPDSIPLRESDLPFRGLDSG